MINVNNLKKRLNEPLWILTIAILLSGIVLFVNLGIKGPMIQADEGSYLSNAAAIAGFYNDMASSYSSGYSILISPAFLLGNTPSEIWKFVRIINALLFCSVVILLWEISKKWKPHLTLFERSAAVVFVSVYPMWVIMTGYSFAQIAFVPFYLLMFLLFLEAASGNNYAWPVLGVVSGFLYWIHPTAVVALIAVCISLLYVSWKLTGYKRFFIFFAVLLVTVFAYRIGITPWLMERMSISAQPANLHYPSISKMLSAVSNWDGLKRVLSIFGGHVFYISLGTLGFIVSGFFVLMSLFFKSTKTETSASEALMLKAGGLFLILSLIGIVSLSAIFMAGAARLDHWMYGRYVEGFIAPVLLAGVLADSWRKTLWAIPVAAVGGGLLALNLDSYIHTAPFNISTFWQEFFIRDRGIFTWLIGGATVVAFVGLLPRKIAYFIAIGFFSFCSYLQIDYHKRASTNASARWDAAMLVRDQYSPGTCVAFDHSGINSYNRHVFWFDFGFVLYDYHLQRMSFQKWMKTCNGPLFSYDKNLNDQNQAVYPAAVSSNGGPILWFKGKPPVIESSTATIAERPVAALLALGAGWHSLERAHVWSSDTAEINLKKSMFPGSKWPSIMKLDVAPYAASIDRPVKIEVQEGGKRYVFNYTDSARKTIEFPLGCKADSEKCKVKFDVKGAISPQQLGQSSDARVLGFALYAFSFKGIHN